MTHFSEVVADAVLELTNVVDGDALHVEAHDPWESNELKPTREVVPVVFDTLELGARGEFGTDEGSEQLDLLGVHNLAVDSNVVNVKMLPWVHAVTERHGKGFGTGSDS